MLRWLWLSLVMLILDQVTKQWAENTLTYGSPVEVLPMLNWTLLYNEGAAFSFLADAGGWQRWFFSGLALIISAVIVVWLSRLKDDERWVAVSLSLILSGAIGNVIDRLLYGHVIDFIDVYYQQYHWPAFNIADSAITVGVVIMLLSAFFDGKERED